MNQRIVKVIDSGFILLLASVCILYSLYSSIFAEIHIRLPFLDFPIFVGEILLFACAVWFIIRWGRLGFPRNKYGWLLLGYLVWLIAKALKGYVDYGPLAFRNAALFYYPLFAVFTGSITRNKQAHHRFVWIGIFVLIIIIQLHGTFGYFFLPYFLLAVLCLLYFPDEKWKIAGLFAIAVVFPFYRLFDRGRAELSGILTAFVFLSIIVIRIFLPFNLKKRWIAGMIAASILIGAGAFFAADYKFATVANIPHWLKEYQKGDRIIQQKKDDFQRGTIDPKLYHSDREVIIARGGEPKIPPEIHCKQKAVNTAYGNILFRLYIWRDILQEYWSGNRLTGVSFGRPLRSVSIEILQMAWGEWSRDGWIMPHSVFMHIIYRAGLVGAVLIAGIFLAWGAMVQSFIRFHSFEGLLLCAILIYWLVVAAFSVTLELPYQAIPFWSLWGCTWAYRQNLMNRTKAERRGNGPDDKR